MADYKSTLTVPGEVNVLRLEIEARGKLLDVSALVADLTIYEDIFSNTMSGYIVMVDALDLINTLPLVGEELLYVELETPSLKSKIKKLSISISYLVLLIRNVWQAIFYTSVLLNL
jgi:hypothetical protein